MPGPLSGYRIVDLTSNVSGPLATMILGDQGADVIKVEAPDGGDATRAGGNRRAGFTASFVNNNRNKRSIVLDLKKPAAVQALLRLAAGADVFVQNFRPGVAERLGVGEAAVRDARPDIVYVSISGFGEKGPYAAKPAYDPVIQGFSGLATVQAGSDEVRPRLLRTILPDKLTAITASQAITAALLARERTGEGQHVRLSMLEAVLAFMWASDMSDQTFVGDEPPRQTPASAHDLIYDTADGYITAAALTDRQWAGLAQAVGHPEWIEDERFRTSALRQKNIDATAGTHAAGVDDPPGGGMARAADRGAGAVRPGADAQPSDPASAGRGVGPGGRNRAPESRPAAPDARGGAVFKTPAKIRRGAPGLGEHTEEIMAELGYSREEIAGLRAEGSSGPDKSAGNKTRGGTRCRRPIGFTSSIAGFYDRYLGPLIFVDYAEDLARRAAALHPARVLETAAGTGVVTRALARLLAAEAEITATDLNQAMLDFAAAQPGSERVTWRQADAQRLPFEDGSFDMVLCQFGVMFFPDRAGRLP